MTQGRGQNCNVTVRQIGEGVEIDLNWRYVKTGVSKYHGSSPLMKTAIKF